MRLIDYIKSAYHSLPFVRHQRTLISAMNQLNAELRAMKSIMAMECSANERHRNKDRYQDPKRLLKFGFQTCSQNGEDGIIHEIFNRIGVTNKVFVEIGVGDGCENNTAALLSQNWTGLWIDGDPSFLDTIAKRIDLSSGCLKSKVTFVTKENVDKLLSEFNIPRDFDLLSLDVDQNTYHLWEGIVSFKPRCVVIEYNASVHPEVDWHANYREDRIWDYSNNYSASLKALERLGREKGYSLVGCEFIGMNAFFIRDDLVEDRFCRPFTAENHFEPNRVALLNRLGHRNSILDRMASLK